MSYNSGCIRFYFVFYRGFSTKYLVKILISMGGPHWKNVDVFTGLHFIADEFISLAVFILPVKNRKSCDEKNRKESKYNYTVFIN